MFKKKTTEQKDAHQKKKMVVQLYMETESNERQLFYRHVFNIKEVVEFILLTLKILEILPIPEGMNVYFCSSFPSAPWFSLLTVRLFCYISFIVISKIIILVIEKHS